MRVLHSLSVSLLVAASLTVLGCKDEEKPTAPSPSASTAAASSAPTAAAAPSASASAAPAASADEPRKDCPAGSSGPGTYQKPCDAKGNARAMEVKWTKTGDDGPQFAVTNKLSTVIMWGKIAVYFYDKAGKQMDTTDDSGKAKHFHTCSGQFFGGPMNPNEKEKLTFSCVPKKVIPDGATTVEAEMQMVGFADASGKKVDFFWRNNDLAPDARPKGGVK
jgi:hypothetical protein